MSRFPKFHGISLAAGAFIENLRAERLESDPVAAGPGRIWYNTTERLLKYTSLNESGGVVVQVFGNPDAIEALAARLDTVESEYVDADFVDAKIAELGHAVQYVGELTPGASESSTLDLSTLGETRPGAYYKADAAGYVTLGGKTRYVNRKDGVLFNASGTFDVVDNTNSEVDGTAEFVTVTGSADTGFTIDLAASFKARIVDLEQGLSDESSARQSGDNALGSRIDGVESDLSDESSARQSGDAALHQRADGIASDLSAESQARQSADSALSQRADTIESNLSSESQARQDADAALSSRLDDTDAAADTLAGRVSDAESAIAGLDDRLTDAETLPGKINAQRFTYQSSAAAIEHAIDHNLNSAFVVAVVWTEGSDGVYRQDIVEVEETNANRMTVRLTESARIKAAIQVVEPV